MAVMLEFEDQLYSDMFQNDALLIMAEGLGIERVFTNFIKLYSDPAQLVMILNTSESEDTYFIRKIRANKELESQAPVRITTDTHSMNDRTEAYMKGGCFFVTSRILVVDMLCDRIPIDLISGILVYNAHTVIDSCQESFILRMFRQKNKTGFIKAFSDNPTYFAKSFCKVDRIMRNLFVKKLFLYPRFHVDIESELSKNKPELIEIHIGLSEYSSRTQLALFDIINVLLQEFKGCCTYIDHDFLTMEMVISKPFDRICKSQLEPIWNQLGTKPKQLLSDIKTLRLLLYYLIQYDCITFYKMLTCLKSHEKELGRSSGWMFLDAANELYTVARLRVYGTNMKTTYTKADLMNNRLFYNKEFAPRIIKESPKLKALKEVLQEIGREENESEEVNILITANDDRTCSQIKSFLTKNNLTMRKPTDRVEEDNLDQDYDKFNIIDENTDRYTEEKDEEFVVKMILKPTHKNGIDYIKRPQNKRVEKILKGSKKDLKRKNSDRNGVETLTQMVRKKKLGDGSAAKSVETDGDAIGADDALEILNDSDSNSKSSDGQEDDSDSDKSGSYSPCEEANDNTGAKKYQNTSIFLSAFSGGVKQRISLIKLLAETKPKYVILYDCELRFVRQLEIYKAIHYELPMRVYFFMYSNSCEEQRYLTSVRQEKEAFEILIKEKATMIVPEEQDGKIDLTAEETDKPTIRSQMNSRQGGAIETSGNNNANSAVVIVDMREFRSELPSILHKRGFHIEPCTLEVGDYVITPTICVERKSINDLIESLHNGRLYNQASSMSRAYKIPVLLIEFDQKKPFQLNTYQQLASNDININHTSSKLVLLIIHFPKLRILWCSNPGETAEIFEELKSGCEEPNAEDAMAIKNDQVIEDEEYKYNPILWDLLLKIPGINSKNIKSIMTKVPNLHDLCQMSEAELTEIIENSRNAKLIYEFMNKTVKHDVNLFDPEVNFEDINEFLEVDKKSKGIETAEVTSGRSKGKKAAAKQTTKKAPAKKKK